MANAVEKVNTIAIASIEAINTITDANLEALNTLEFTGAAADAHTLISTHTASSSSSLDITSGIDSTYDVYQWFFTNMHPASEDGDNRQFTFQVNAAGGSGFNETITSLALDIYHSETDSGNSFGYNTSRDQGNGTAYQQLIYGLGADSDQSCSGVLTMYGPSSTTYVKKFTCVTNGSYHANYTMQNIITGYFNTTSAIDEISFKMNSGNIDSGVIKMYGIAKS